MSNNATFAYLGPLGTYCNEAAQAFAHKMGIAEPEFVECPSFNEIYEAVERGRCEFGIMAFENSLEGPVTATLDAFAFRNGISIVGSLVLDIHHCLLLNKDATLDDIEIIASHPQALGQCRRYLNEHFPRLERVSTLSTAHAAKLASENKHIAAIGNSYAASMYGCKVEQPDIEDHFGNQTQFVLIARQGHPAVLEGAKHATSIALFLGEDKPGALLMILSEFAYAGVNMTRIQSRPTKQGLGSYMFFVDIEGDQNDPSIKTALDCLRLKIQEVKVLGTYPIGLRIED